jgi:hypothetical protein
VKFAAIHQIAAGFAKGDAISLEAVAIRDLCRDLGVASEIYVPAERIAPDCRTAARALEAYRPGAGELLIFHYSIQSPATEAFRRSPARKVVVYHNVTPGDLFRAFDEPLAARLEAARGELAEVARAADAVWADSAFNAAEVPPWAWAACGSFRCCFRPPPSTWRRTRSCGRGCRDRRKKSCSSAGWRRTSAWRN